MKSIRKLRLSRAVLLATPLALLALILAQPPIVKAQTCSNATLNGTYGYGIGGFSASPRRGS